VPGYEEGKSRQGSHGCAWLRGRKVSPRQPLLCLVTRKESLAKAAMAVPGYEEGKSRQGNQFREAFSVTENAACERHGSTPIGQLTPFTSRR